MTEFFAEEELEDATDLFDPEIIYSKDKSLKLRKSEYFDSNKRMIKLFVMYREIKPNNTPEACALVINEKKNYGLVLRKGKDRFWRITSIFSTSDKDDVFKNHVFSTAQIVQDKTLRQELVLAEDELPEIKRI